MLGSPVVLVTMETTAVTVAATPELDVLVLAVVITTNISGGLASSVSSHKSKNRNGREGGGGEE